MKSRVERYYNSKSIQAKQKFYKRKSFIWTLIALGCLILGSIGFYSYSIFHAVKQVGNGNMDPITSAAAWSGTDRVNILILGVDNRNNDPNPRSDSMIVASIDPVSKTAVEFSVMRDSYVHIPGHGYDKINAAYADGGPNLAIQTVSEFLQIPIHYYVETDFQGFEKVVDALGGVTINVEKDMVYADDGVYDINLHQGVQQLDGQHALMYVRFRHDATSDYTRTQRQRTFLKAVAQKMATPKGLLELPQVISAMAPYVHTNMSLNDMVAIGRLGASVNSAAIESVQIPPSDNLTEMSSPDVGDILLPDVYACVQAVHQKLGMTTPIDRSKIDQPQVSAPASAPAGTNADSSANHSVNLPPASNSQGAGHPAGSGNTLGSSNQAGSGNQSSSGNYTGSGNQAGASNQTGSGNLPNPGSHTGSGNQAGSGSQTNTGNSAPSGNPSVPSTGGSSAPPAHPPGGGNGTVSGNS